MKWIDDYRLLFAGDPSELNKYIADCERYLAVLREAANPKGGK